MRIRIVYTDNFDSDKSDDGVVCTLTISGSPINTEVLWKGIYGLGTLLLCSVTLPVRKVPAYFVGHEAMCGIQVCRSGGSVP